jgi:hypothetical protein
MEMKHVYCDVSTKFLNENYWCCSKGTVKIPSINPLSVFSPSWKGPPPLPISHQAIQLAQIVGVRTTWVTCANDKHWKGLAVNVVVGRKGEATRAPVFHRAWDFLPWPQCMDGFERLNPRSFAAACGWHCCFEIETFPISNLDQESNSMTGV